MGRLKLRLLIIALVLLAQARGQSHLSINFSREVQPKLRDQILTYEGALTDSVDLHSRITAVKVLLFQEAFLLSRASLDIRDTNAILNIDPGPMVFTKKLHLKLPPDLALPQFEDLSKPEGAIDSSQFRKLMEGYLSFLEEHGYPFASIEVENYNFNNDSLDFFVRVQPGPLITIDSIIVKGFNRFSQNVLKYDLQYRKGMLYRESYLKKLPELTGQVEYLKMTGPPAVAFNRSKTILYIYMEEVKSNQVDGVAGLKTEEDGNVVFTGDLQLRLLHVLKKGEEFRIRWRRPDESVQSLNFDFEIPYILRTPLWLEGNLAIFRQDSSFVNTDAQGLLKYLLESGSFISGGVSYRASNVLLSSDLNPAFRSFNTTFYKLGLELRKTNRIIVPTRGFRMTGYGLTGKRKTTEFSQEQFGWQLLADQYIPVFKRHILKIGLRSEALFGGKLFVNEQYRIGGLKTLRGFNEQSIYASRYGIGTLEYRYMIGNYDYLTVFSDLAYVENNAGEEFATNLFTGIGAGINFQTRAGVFSLFYAVGKDDQNPFDLRTSKIHFGYINRF